MATRAQKAAARRNIKKAQAARRRKRGGRSRRRAAPRRRRRAAALQQNRRRPVRRRRAAPRRRRAASNAALLANLKPLLENARKRRSYAASEMDENPGRRRRRRRAAPKRRARRRMRRNPVRKNPVRRNPTTKVVLLGNSWPGESRRHAAAARKGARKRRNRGGRKRTAASRRRVQRRSRRRSPRRRNQMMLQNPSMSMMQENPSLLPNQIAGAYSRANLMAYGTAAAGVAVGLLVADFVDRYVATRKPADAASGAVANNPWYGRDAAAAQRMRPDAWRLGTQAAGAVVALGLAYWTRGSRLVPWLLGGTAIGFGANLLKMLADWWLMPAVLKTKADNEASFANRMYPLEQAAIQDQVTEIFANWDKTEALAAGQLTTPDIRPPLTGSAAGGADVYTLGRANAGGTGNGRFFKNTGRLGNCPGCGGYNGCWSDCQTQCSECPGYRPHKKCSYVVQAPGELEALAAQSGVTMADVAAMNGGRTSFATGETVVLPYGMCALIETRTSQPIQPIAPPGFLPVQPIVPTTVVTTTPGPGYLPTPPTFVPGTYVPPVVAGVPQGNGNGNGHSNSNGHTQVPDQFSSIYRVGVQDE